VSGLDGHPQAVLDRLRAPELATPAVEAIRSLLQLCPAGYCRSSDFHDRTGYYARLFARGKVRAYIGYSETIHYGLQEIADTCGPSDGCRTPEQIAVRAVPPITPLGRPVGWVDALAISSELTEKKRHLAEEFIEFLTSWEAYALVLNPEWPAAPRYLLPAVVLSSHQSVLKSPLYQDFATAFGSRIILTADDTNTTLRGHGKALDCQLAPERGDNRWEKQCSPNSTK